MELKNTKKEDFNFNFDSNLLFDLNEKEKENDEDNDNNNFTLQHEIKMLRNYENLSFIDIILLERKIQKNGMELLDLKIADELFDVIILNK